MRPSDLDVPAVVAVVALLILVGVGWGVLRNVRQRFFYARARRARQRAERIRDLTGGSSCLRTLAEVSALVRERGGAVRGISERFRYSGTLKTIDLKVAASDEVLGKLVAEIEERRAIGVEIVVSRVA
jgi:hypothetical protein